MTIARRPTINPLLFRVTPSQAPVTDPSQFPLFPSTNRASFHGLVFALRHVSELVAAISASDLSTQTRYDLTDEFIRRRTVHRCHQELVYDTDCVCGLTYPHPW